MHLKRHLENWLWIVPLIAFVVIAGAPAASFSSSWLDGLWDLFGLLLTVLGATVRTCARGWKHEQGKQELVTTGPYAYVRHPLYLGTLLCGLGVCIIHGSVLVILGYVVSFALWHAIVIRREERQLRARWPEVHAAYRARVPLLLPRPTGFVRLLATWPTSVRAAIVREADAIFWWPMAGILVRLWEAAGPRAEFTGHRTMAVGLTCVLAVLAVAWAFVKHGPHARRSPG